MLLLNVAPLGNAGSIDQVTGPVAPPPSVALGAVIASATVSSVENEAVTPTATDPALCVTMMLNDAEPASPVATRAASE